MAGVFLAVRGCGVGFEAKSVAGVVVWDGFVGRASKQKGLNAGCDCCCERVFAFFFCLLVFVCVLFLFCGSTVIALRARFVCLRRKKKCRYCLRRCSYAFRCPRVHWHIVVWRKKKVFLFRFRYCFTVSDRLDKGGKSRYSM